MGGRCSGVDRLDRHSVLGKKYASGDSWYGAQEIVKRGYENASAEVVGVGILSRNIGII